MEFLNPTKSPLPPVLTDIIWSYIPGYRWYLRRAHHRHRRPFIKRNRPSTQKMAQYLEAFLADEQLEAIELLMKTYTTFTSNQLFHWATLEGHTQVVKYLLSNGNVPSNATLGLFHAAKGNYPAIINALLPSNTTRLWQEFGTIIKGAARGGHLNLIRRFIYAIRNGYVPKGVLHRALWIAAREGHLEVVKYLVSWGADSFEKAIREARKNNHGEMVRYLTEEELKSVSDQMNVLEGDSPVL